MALDADLVFYYFVSILCTKVETQWIDGLAGLTENSCDQVRRIMIIKQPKLYN